MALDDLPADFDRDGSRDDHIDFGGRSIATGRFFFDFQVRFAFAVSMRVSATRKLISISGDSRSQPPARGAASHGQRPSKLFQSISPLVVFQGVTMELANGCEEVRERERGRIARELHDELQQPLAFIRMNVAQIALQLGAGDAAVIPLLAEIDAVTIAAIDSTRRIVNDLRPQVLDDLGIEAAMEDLVIQFGRRNEITMSLTIRGDLDGALRHCPMAADCIYRVTQEALTNIAKHSRAASAAVEVMIATDSRLVLCIRDHGVGISPSDRRKPASFGLIAMRERVRAVQGVLRIDGRPGAGTCVEVTLAARILQQGR